MSVTSSIAVKDTANDFIEGSGYIEKIPVKNIWLLIFYASDLFRQLDKASKVSLEENPDDIPNLVAEILSRQVEQRIKRNLSFGYQTREATLNRVRGRIDLLKTERHRLFEKGQVFCRFDELTINTPRNRFVRSALEKVSRLVEGKQLSYKCKSLAKSLKNMGVVGEKPGRAEGSIESFGRHDINDRKMVAAAQLVFNLALPTEFMGTKHIAMPDRTITWIRKIYEKGVAGFYDVALSQNSQDKWLVKSGEQIYWPIDQKSLGIDKIFPSMQTDITLRHKASGRQIVIDTKFNSVVTKGQYRGETIRSGYIYQIYAYLRSQEGKGECMSDKATGILLHPSVGTILNESVTIQGHEIRFATVDLSAESKSIRQQLLKIIDDGYEYL